MDFSIYNINQEVNYNNDTEYRKSMLDVFNMTEFDDKKINNYINLLFNHLIKENKFKELFKESANSLFLEDLEIGLMQLFSYHCFKIWHNILISYLKFNKIEDNLVESLNKQFVRK
tara:strand:- start:125 stop:472 length:348 start_codon:yes stop_codon:yes gene_type:complete